MVYGGAWPEREVRFLIGVARSADNLCIERSYGGAKTLRDDLRVVPQSGLRISMPKVTLHVLHRGVTLDVGG